MQFRVHSQHYKALQKSVIGVRNKPMKMTKNVDGFWLPSALNMEYGENV